MRASTSEQEAARCLPGPTGGSARERRFRELYEYTLADLVRFVQRRVPPDAVEDVVAEVFVVLWRRLEDVPGNRMQARAWLFGVARNGILTSARSHGRREALAVRISQAPAQTLSPDLTDEVDTRVDLVSAWSKLDPTQQETLALTVFDDLTSAEAAQVLGITSANYRVRLMRARRALRGHLDRGELL